MKLKKLEISGFKSFPEKASISFPPGISAVVGPNGCGKSNIVDALRWVMGEQSVKQLRGKSMEDVIFAGADGKSPLNMAEVSLTLINDNGSAPEELRAFSEIMLTRRLFRSGESAYLLNKQPCRLKDIHNVFMGSGMGAKSYAIIQQGNVGAITDAGPDERRVFIEEAAGITRYKQRKVEALRKVEQTNQNLLRVNDIIAEIQRQMASLDRQAKKAAHYNHLQQQIRDLDIRLSLHQHTEYCQRIREGSRVLAELKDADIAHSSRLKKLDAAVEEIRLRRAQKDQEISTQKGDRYELQRRIDRVESDLSHLRGDLDRLAAEIVSLESARTELEGKNADIHQEVQQAEQRSEELTGRIDSARGVLERSREEAAAMKSRLAEASRRLDGEKGDLMELVTQEARYKNIYQTASNTKESLKRRLKRADEEVALARSQVSALEGRRTTAEQDLQACSNQVETLAADIERVRGELQKRSAELARQVKETQTLEFERSKLRSKYGALKKMEENFEWYRDGVRAIMTAQGKAAVPPESPHAAAPLAMALVADIVEPEPSYETAVEAVLGEALQFILVADQPAAAAGIGFLQRQDAGRSGFIPLDGIKPPGTENSRRPAAKSRLLNHLKVKTGFEPIADTLLGHVAVAEDLTEALAVFNANGVSQTLVTKNGDVILREGLLIGGSREKLSGILAKKQEIRQLAERIESVGSALEAALGRQGEMEAGVRDLESGLQRHIERRNGAEHDLVEAEKGLYRIGEELKHSRRHLDVALLEQERLMGEESDVDEELSQYHRALEDIAEQVRTAQERVSQSTAALQELTDETEDFDQRVMDQKLEMTRLSAKLENTHHTLRRLREFQQDGLQRLAQVTRDIAAKTERCEAARVSIEDSGQALKAMYKSLNQLDQTLERSESEYQDIDNRIRINDQAISEIQGLREKTLEKFRLLELEQSQHNIQRNNILARLEEKYQISFERIKAQFDAPEDGVPQADDATVEDMQTRLGLLRDKIARITDVNLGAIKEYDQHKERFEFLSAQRDDLLKAIDDLMKVIKKINRITQTRFIETFEQVNSKLAEVFPRLFEGGSARLTLTEPDKPLETGVEFMVHPPGKKLTRMTLLSGGEKALSAIALIFSLFLIRPAAFCIMDEIDAPLDDANVSRFNNLLKLIGINSQIIMITHNKHTMEFADTLFGITMQKKGISKVVSVDFSQAAQAVN